MKRVDINEPFTNLLASARRIAEEVKAQAVVLLTDLAYDFAAIRNELHPVRLVVATDKVELFRPVLDDDVDLVPLVQEPESRRLQLSQALLEAIADELLQGGDTVVALYPGFEMHDIDTCSVISLGEHLARLTSRDLQRLETQVPLETLRSVVDLAIEIGREGREGKPVGTLFVIGDSDRVLAQSHQLVINPFHGYPESERNILDPRLEETIKEFSAIDGAFIVRGDGVIMAAGRYLAPRGKLEQALPHGLGTRHEAAASITAMSAAVALCISQSTGTVSVFKGGRLLTDIPKPWGRTADGL